MEFFVDKESVVRKIWGKGDTILFVFAGSAAEFALNKAVDWLYFTGRLPADPLGRLFSTVMYARLIVFSEKEQALQAIDKITSIHQSVEKSRSSKIPDWAYRDVLFMLIHYSIASFELLERKLREDEKEELFAVFYKIGERMGLKELPKNYNEWIIMHKQHLQNDLQKSNYTVDLYKQYKKHLGAIRFLILKESQKLVVPSHVNQLLHLGKATWIRLVVVLYKLSRKVKLDGVVRAIILPPAYKKQFKALNIEPT
jgi:ER-bound oxygenase mpaB/B'/Rubber oxygenase, catalytic domain